MLKCYLLDDEPDAIDALAAMLQKKFATLVQVCGKCTDAQKAIDEIEKLQPDVLFLDVEMPALNGLEVLRHFTARKFQVIFTTAHEKYALPAIKLEAADYLVKPLSPQDVHDALHKCIQRNQPASPSPISGKISLSTNNGLLVVDTTEIIRIEASSNYSYFYFTNNQKVVVSKTLKEFDEMLSAYPFFRVHQSHLINLKHIVAVKSDDGDYVLLTQGHRAEISRRKKAALLEQLKR